MPYHDITLPLTMAGTTRTLRVHRFGQVGARPKVVLQAALHANEFPGIAACWQLLPELEAAHQAGQVPGEVVVIAAANPVGLDQFVDRFHLGRFDLASGDNFNRHHGDFQEPLRARVEGQLGGDGAANVERIRRALGEIIAERQAATTSQIEAYRLILFALSHDADYVLDLHCDCEAQMHLYTSPRSAAALEPLARLLGCTAVLLAERSGGDPFDEALSQHWAGLAATFPEAEIPQGCHSCTVELRGEADVSDAFAEQDAAALAGFLRHVGALAGAPPVLPEPLCRATPLTGTDMVEAPVAGLVFYSAEVGEIATPGQTLGWILDPVSGARTPFVTRAEGVVFARLLMRWVPRGEVVIKVAGATPLPGRSGNLLTAR